MGVMCLIRIVSFILLRWMDELLPIGLVDIRGHLGDEFVDRNTRAGCEARFIQDTLADFPGDVGGLFHLAFVFSHL